MTNLIEIYRQSIINNNVSEMITLFAGAGNGYYLSDNFLAAIDDLNYTENSTKKNNSYNCIIRMSTLNLFLIRNIRGRSK